MICYLAPAHILVHVLSPLSDCYPSFGGTGRGGGVKTQNFEATLSLATPGERVQQSGSASFQGASRQISFIQTLAPRESLKITDQSKSLTLKQASGTGGQTDT